MVQEEYLDLLGISAVIISEKMCEYSPGSYEGVDMLVVLMRSIVDDIIVHNGRVYRFQQHKERGRDVPKWDGARDVVGAGRRNDVVCTSRKRGSRGYVGGGGRFRLCF